MLDRTPYIYFLYWEANDRHSAKMYIGSQHGKGCHPSKLWKTYFTSSWYVKQFRQAFGEPDKIFTIECTDYEGQAGRMEEMFLRKVRADRNQQFINLSITGRTQAKYTTDQIVYMYGLLGSIEEVAYALNTSTHNVAQRLNAKYIDWSEWRSPSGRTVVNWLTGRTKPRGFKERQPLPLFER